MAGLGYVLCASPRSGSTLLCDLLAQSGVAGAPESYFRPGSVAGYAERWAVAPDTDGWGRLYVDAVVRHGEAATGCVGIRAMGTDMPALLDRLARLYPGPESDSERLFAVLGVEHFVHLTRVDKAAQAVSLVMASQTGVWHRNADGTVLQQSPSVGPVHYDYELIETELEMLEAEERWWAAWFAAQSITPLGLTYEQLAVNPDRTASEVLGFIGRHSPNRLVVGTQQLATALSDEWTARFKTEWSGRGASDAGASGPSDQ